MIKFKSLNQSKEFLQILKKRKLIINTLLSTSKKIIKIIDA